MAAWVMQLARIRVPNNPRWLDVVTHRIPRFRAPYLLIVQHHDIPSATLLAAPVTPSLYEGVLRVAPLIEIDNSEFRVRLLDMSAVSRTLIGDSVTSFASAADGILDALDIILHGYPVGRPH